MYAATPDKAIAAKMVRDSRITTKAMLAKATTAPTQHQIAESALCRSKLAMLYAASGSVMNRREANRFLFEQVEIQHNKSFQLPKQLY